MKQLDITSFGEKGVALTDAIQNAVKDTQRVVVQPYPYEILMTNEQHTDLESIGALDSMFESKDQIYMTKYNVMEVKIKGEGNQLIWTN